MYSHYCGKDSVTSSSTSLIDGIIDEWHDELSDKIRKWMEECDALKGIQCVINNDKSLFGGIAASVLEFNPTMKHLLVMGVVGVN